MDQREHIAFFDAYLVRIVLQRTVITLVTNPIVVSIFLIHIVQIRTVILFIQNTWENNLELVMLKEVLDLT